MSGFAGIVRLEPSPETDEADRVTIARMAEAIAFRGPDAQHQLVQDGAAFAFSLLTTGPAPQALAQPVTLDGQTFLLGEARIDGRDELIARLRQHGAAVSSRTPDEELVLRLLLRFGFGELSELDGDFSLILWNALARKLLAFRDLSGARPFFYALQNGRLLFSNTLQALAGSGAVRRQDFDAEFIANFLLGSPHYDPQQTIYADVRRLPAGSSLEFSGQGLSLRPIAHYPVAGPPQSMRDREVLEEFRRLLGLAVRDRLPESEATILLSGGLDSTSVAALAVKQRRTQDPGGALKLGAFTIDFCPLFQDEEALLARDFAASLNLPHQFIHVGHILPLEGASVGPVRLPEPPDYPYPGLQPFHVSCFPPDSRVLLSGDGGDEILRAEAAPFLHYVASRYGKTRVASLLLRYMLTRRRLPALGAGLRRGILRLLKRGPAAPPSFPAWIEPHFESQYNLRKRFTEMNEKPWSSHPYHPWSYAKLVRFIPPLMEGQDATFSGRPVEARAPFLDRRLIRFLLRLPPIPWFMDKDLLRRAQQGVLPERIRLRPKMPLQYDPLQLHMAARKWCPVPPKCLPSALQGIVDWPQLNSVLTTAPGNELYVHLGPVLLALWLNAVEKRDVIQ